MDKDKYITCVICKNCKPEECFSVASNKRFGRENRCRECRNKMFLQYYHSVDGVIKTMYSTQKKLSEKRGYSPPSYNIDELRAFLLSDNTFLKYYNDWVDSGYNKWFKPSCDRINDYKPYTLDNIVLTNWYNNKKKFHEYSMNGKNKKRCKAVVQRDLDDNKINQFFSIHNASRTLGISATTICRVCRGKQETSGGYKWTYL